MRFIKAFAFLMCLALFCESATADIIFYKVPNMDYTMRLQGTYKVNAGGTVSFKHPKFGYLHMSLRDTKRHKVPSTKVLGRRTLAKANKSKDPYEAMAAADWALHHGQLDMFYKAIDLTLELDPKHEDALRIMELKKVMDVPVPKSPKLRAFMKKENRIPGFRFARSKHFLLYHDTPERPAKGRRVNRATERLELLETVYESFFLKFYSQGVPLAIPKEPLMVLLFNERSDFTGYSEGVGTGIYAIGFWHPVTNIGVFFDHSTAPRFEGLKQQYRTVSDAARRARMIRSPQAKDLIRTAKTLKLLIKIEQEKMDIEVVSHEATHQLAGNTSLFPRVVNIPSWVHEGLASYFEAPNDTAWAGIGAVNEERLEMYRVLAANDREHSSLDFIVGDQIFTQSANINGTLHAYAQAWALTHFMIERHFDEAMEFYRRLGDMPPDTPISSEVLNEMFDEVFEDKRQKLEGEWRGYMSSLRTDIEILLEGSQNEDFE